MEKEAGEEGKRTEEGSAIYTEDKQMNDNKSVITNRGLIIETWSADRFVSFKK